MTIHSMYMYVHVHVYTCYICSIYMYMYSMYVSYIIHVYYVGSEISTQTKVLVESGASFRPCNNRP